jgi:hypothetical protein
MFKRILFILFAIFTFAFADFHIFAKQVGGEIKCIVPPYKMHKEELNIFLRAHKNKCYYIAKAMKLNNKELHTILFSTCKEKTNKDIVKVFLKCHYNYNKEQK